ncbi:hypothetical protein J2X36_000046 [Methylobacterium sp. BE186]|nr:hypothetical protein [Methylobacterium sp. BE186]
MVEAAPEQAPAVERHRHHAIRLGDELAPARRHHPRHRHGEIEPVLVLEAVHDLARRPVIEGNGARPPEDRRFGDGAGREEGAEAEIEGEGRAVAGAERGFDQAQRGPAAGAEGAGIGRRRPAGRAGRRVDEAERDPEQRSESGHRGEERCPHAGS